VCSSDLYDIILNFSWRTTLAKWVDLAGTRHDQEYISWNCCWFEGVARLFAANYGAGWYESGYFSLKDTPGIELGWQRKFLDAESGFIPIDFGALGANHPFDALFLTNAP
jgi:hypothetical protein